jgi:hypothetical protein
VGETPTDVVAGEFPMDVLRSTLLASP